MTRLFTTLLSLLVIVFTIKAQNSKRLIQEYLNKNHSELNLSNEDISNWKITDSHIDKRNGIEFVYIEQAINDIPIQNGIASFAVKDGQISHMGNRLLSDTHKKIPNSIPSLSPDQAIIAVANQLDLPAPYGLNLKEKLSENKFLYSNGDISLEDIPVELMYYHTDEGMHLVWNLSIYEKSAENWWSVSVDAESGTILEKINWVSKCDFGHLHSHDGDGFTYETNENTDNANSTTNSLTGSEYRVFELPLESPNHGPRTLVIDPADTISSPFGWHDTNGASGPEFTITRGNNVFAYTDPNNTGSGFSPDGTSALHFDFPFIPGTAPSSYQSAAVTNLFYMNNMMHDIWYQYGFDEASGNFQFNNYGNGGLGSDEVNAEAQDGGGTNNANFGTPPDGSNPRMQMYIWNNSNGNTVDLTVNSPAIITGTYQATEAAFGPSISTSITSDLVLVDDATAPNPNDACQALVNGPSVNGKIAVIDRGDCTFVTKIEFAQNAGAIAVIMVNNVGGNPITMGGTSPNISIPSVMISLANGNLIKNAMSTGTVNVTLNPATNNDIDGDFDNGIIAHEFGHGISNRLTGGPSNTGCLSSAEQMGEGWSDWFGLMITIEPGDQGTDTRGIGTFASNQPTTGNGIRPAPYSTDFAVNSFTYGASNSNSISQPHGLGFVYATALWDLNWALINQYGGIPDPDLLFGSGGNNIAMNLVVTSLKLQPCNPGMLDGRDAVLAADQLLYNGAHQCLIWNVFANRGFGFSASQGSPNSRFDQVEAFDIPPFCQVATMPPSANFTFGPTAPICETGVAFTDASLNAPQNWVWDFGDGTIDTTFDPTHIYETPGTYSVKMIVSNSLGVDSMTKSITVATPNALVVDDKDVCLGQNAVMIANNNLGTVEWYDAANNLVSTNNLYIGFNITSDRVFYVRDKLGPFCFSEYDTINITYLESDFTYSQNGRTVNFTDLSTGASSWLWDFGDGNTSASQNPLHTYANAGSFNVTLSLNNQPCNSSQSISVVNSLLENFAESFEIYPNPARNQFTIKLKEQAISNLSISIENMQGSILKELEIAAGEKTIDINIEGLSSAMYLLRIKNSKTQSVHKLLIEK